MLLRVMAKKRPLSDAVLDYFRAKGREGGTVGGQAGGKARWEGVSAKDRAAHARRMVAAREAKRASKKPPIKKPPLRGR